MRALLYCIHISMHNTTVLALAHRVIDGIHHTFTIRCVHHCIYLSLGMHCARYGAWEGRARSEMGEALPGILPPDLHACRKSFLASSELHAYMEMWRYAFLFKEDRVDQSLST